jgi:hypothetical protein
VCGHAVRVQDGRLASAFAYLGDTSTVGSRTAPPQPRTRFRSFGLSSCPLGPSARRSQRAWRTSLTPPRVRTRPRDAPYFRSPISARSSVRHRSPNRSAAGLRKHERPRSRADAAARRRPERNAHPPAPRRGPEASDRRNHPRPLSSALPSESQGTPARGISAKPGEPASTFKFISQPYNFAQPPTQKSRRPHDAVALDDFQACRRARGTGGSPRLCARRHGSHGAPRRHGAACVGDPTAAEPTAAHGSSGRRLQHRATAPAQLEPPPRTGRAQLLCQALRARSS